MLAYSYFKQLLRGSFQNRKRLKAENLWRIPCLSRVPKVQDSQTGSNLSGKRTERRSVYYYTGLYIAFVFLRSCCPMAAAFIFSKKEKSAWKTYSKSFRPSTAISRIIFLSSCSSRRGYIFQSRPALCSCATSAPPCARPSVRSGSSAKSMTAA